MNHGFLVAASLSLLAASPAIAGLAIQPGDPNTQRQTGDRLGPDRMEALVAGPIAIVRSGDVAGGERAFEALLAREVRRSGTGSVLAADLLMSFGVLVYSEGLGTSAFEPEDALKERSLPYFRRSIDAYRAAFGADHPELAVALHSYADVLIALHPDDPPAEADAAIEEAYRIRRAALGPANAETLAALGRLAEVRSLPSRTRRDPARITEAAALYREALSHARSGSGQFPEQQPMRWYFHLAQLYARNGQAAAALAIVGEAEREAGGRNCIDIVVIAAEAADLLAEQGLETDAQAMRKRYSEDACPEPAGNQRPLNWIGPGLILG